MYWLQDKNKYYVTYKHEIGSIFFAILLWLKKSINSDVISYNELWINHGLLGTFIKYYKSHM